MAKKNFLLLSLEDTKIKKVSNVISNESCRRILDYLSNKEATESELASKLGIPISTVHYNLQQLMETELVSADEFHYSAKGKEVSHYRLANKYIIIAPKNTFGIKEKLKSILPVVLIVSGAALAIQLVNNYFLGGNIISAKQIAGDAGIAKTAAAPMMAQETAILATQQAQTTIPNIALWFLAGAIFALLVYFIINLMRNGTD
ncbi:MAG: helix-turn-helix domain-containing protein [Nanoarchaeota archaeon]